LSECVQYLACVLMIDIHFFPHFLDGGPRPVATLRELVDKINDKDQCFFNELLSYSKKGELRI